MKIIKLEQPLQKNQFRCWSCLSVLEREKTDTPWSRETIGGPLTGIECPVCGVSNKYERYYE